MYETVAFTYLQFVFATILVVKEREFLDRELFALEW